MGIYEKKEKKVKLDRKELKKKLDLIRNAMDYKSIYNYGQYVIIKDDRIAIYNGDLFLSTPFECELNIAIPAREFISFVTEVTEDTITLERTKDATKISSGRRKVKFFIPPDEGELLDKLPVLNEDLKKLPDNFFIKLAKIEKVVSTRKDVRIIGNFYVNGKRIVASDSYRFGYVELDDYLPVEDDFFIHFVTAKLIKKNKMFWFNTDEAYHFFTNDEGTILGVAEEDGSYIDYQEVMDSETGKSLFFPNEMVEDMKISSIFNTNVNSLDKVVDISVLCDKIIVTGNNDVGSIELEYKFQNKEEAKMAVHPGFFLEGLQNSQVAIFDETLETLLFIGPGYKYIINTY